MTAPTSPLPGTGDGRRLADVARTRRRLSWRIAVCTADHLAAQRGADYVIARLRQHAGPMLVGQIHLCAAGPPNALGRLELLRRGLEQGTIVDYPPAELDVAAASLTADHRRWLIFAAARVLTPQCSHGAVYS